MGVRGAPPRAAIIATAYLGPAKSIRRPPSRKSARFRSAGASCSSFTSSLSSSHLTAHTSSCPSQKHLEVLENHLNSIQQELLCSSLVPRSHLTARTSFCPIQTHHTSSYQSQTRLEVLENHFNSTKQDSYVFLWYLVSISQRTHLFVRLRHTLKS